MGGARNPQLSSSQSFGNPVGVNLYAREVLLRTTRVGIIQLRFYSSRPVDLPRPDLYEPQAVMIGSEVS